ncbi:MAG: 2-oxo acid dehydrogenase subunit E2 [Clostridia bacterium]|nr:2-oxo acid dehydrogenase subunit E2 [Clostridia bacterium]
MKKEKRRLGDRKDGKLIRDLDGMHFITPLIYPNRCDNEAYVAERVDLTAINDYLAKKNAEPSDFPTTMFHVVVAAVLKTITLRPKLNRFIANKNFYQRNDVSAAFVVKKIFSDEGGEALAVVKATDDSTLDTIHQDLYDQIKSLRGGKVDGSTDSMDVLNRMPRFLSKFLVWIITRLDVHGWVPRFLIESDPYYCSVVLSNLGSIKLRSGYHHLTNWGTCSMFCILGEKKLTPVFQPDGTYVMRETLDLGLTIDERLADGYYYSKSIKLLKHLLEHPELLELPAKEKIEL